VRAASGNEERLFKAQTGMNKIKQRAIHIPVNREFNLEQVN
jgi:hypothetical protein